MKAFLVISFLFILCFLPFISFGDEFASPSFKILDPVIKPGAGFSTSSGYELWSSFGQEAIGLSYSSGFGLYGGFLYFPGPSVATSAPTAPPLRIGGGLNYPFFPQPTPPPIRADFNGDGKINIIDLSILLFYYGRSGPSIAKYDLGGNGIVDFIDISILFYYWTV